MKQVRINTSLVPKIKKYLDYENQTYFCRLSFANAVNILLAAQLDRIEQRGYIKDKIKSDR